MNKKDNSKSKGSENELLVLKKIKESVSEAKKLLEKSLNENGV